MKENVVLRNINEKFIKDIADNSFILKKGKDYYEKGRVKSLDIKGEVISGTVLGSSLYKVKIDFGEDIEDYEDEDEEQDIEDYEDEEYDFDEKDPIIDCNCPYPGYGCKHAVAVLYKLFYEIYNKEENRKFAEKGKEFSLFDQYNFEEAIHWAKIDKIVTALDIIRNKKFHLESKTSDSLVISLKDGKRKYKVRLLSVNFGKDRTLSLVESCDCGEGFKHNPCAHLLTARFLLLKKKENFPKDYEAIVRAKLDKERYGDFVDKLEAVDTLQKRKKQFRLYFSVHKKRQSILFSVEKGIVLKSGRIGKRSSVNMKFVKEKYDEFSEYERRLFDLMFSFLNNEAYSFYYGGNNRVEKDDFETERDSALLDQLRVIYEKDPGSFLNVDIPNEKAYIEFHFEDNDGKNKEQGYIFKVKARFKDKTFDLKSSEISLFGNNSLWMYIPGEVYGRNEKNEYEKGVLAELECSNPKIIKKLFESSGIEISNSVFHKLIEEKYTKLSEFGNVHLPEEYALKEVNDITPIPRIFLRDYGLIFCIELRFLYGRKEAFYKNNFDMVFRNKKGEIVKIKRNKEAEEKYAGDLLKISEKKDDIFLPAGDPLIWLCEKSQELISKGFEIYGQDSLFNFKVSNITPRLKIEVRSGIDWFDIEGEVKFGEEIIGFDVVRKALCKQDKFIRLSDGRIGIIPQKWLDKLSGVMGFLEDNENDSLLRAARTQIQIIDALEDIADESSVDAKYKEMKDKFKKFKGIKNVDLPKKLEGRLREYQKAGYDWLHFLKEFGFGGCLADDMGLGKTLQVLTLLLYEKENYKEKKISLIIVPTSLIFNWVQEVGKFAPDLKVYVHHGLGRFKDWKKIDNGKIDIVLTSYGTLRNDVEFFKEKDFNYIILDESQQIKNPLAKSSHSVCSLKGKYRLALTGTPVENNYLELWSQFNFLNPGLLGRMDYFKDTFMSSADLSKEQIKSNALKGIIHPFLLMRKKEQVAQELPNKQIMTIYSEMGEEQSKIYESWKEKYRNEIKESIESNGFNRSKFKILEGILRLRQICNHPLLVDESFTGESEKFNVLMSKIKEVVSGGHKILVFSSFIKMLHLFREEFKEEGIKFCYLDGQTKNRKEVVEEFQGNDDVKVFLISLKAGGLGLNLTAADYVFLVDPWWNPAAEMQAIDRAHRIGQEKKVFVYKMITKDSIEEKILELQNSKLDMVKKVIAGEKGIFKQLSPEDINYFFETKEARF